MERETIFNNSLIRRWPVKAERASEQSSAAISSINVTVLIVKTKIDGDTDGFNTLLINSCFVKFLFVRGVLSRGPRLARYIICPRHPVSGVRPICNHRTNYETMDNQGKKVDGESCPAASLEMVGNW